MRHYQGIHNLPEQSVRELAGKTSELRTLNVLQHFAKHLTTLDQDFRDCHSLVVDLTEKPDTLAVEQDGLNKHNDKIATQTAELIAACNVTKVPDEPSNQQKISASLYSERFWTGPPQILTRYLVADLTSRHFNTTTNSSQTSRKSWRTLWTHLFPLDMSNDDELEVTLSNLTELRSECALRLRHGLNSLFSWYSSLVNFYFFQGQFWNQASKTGNL